MPRLGRELRGEGRDAARERGIRVCEGSDVAAWDDEDVEGRDGPDVAEREDVVLLAHDRRRDLVGRDPAKEAASLWAVFRRALGHPVGQYAHVDLPAVVVSYLLGSISFPWLVAWWHGIDLRARGAHKLGGGDLARVMGIRWGAVGGLLDAAKGAAAVLLAAALGLPVEVRVLCALAAVAGQMWPIFHDLDGGRANSTAWGAILALDPIAAIPAAIVLGAGAVARALLRPVPTRVIPVAALLTFLVWSATIYEVEGVTPTVAGGVAIFALLVIRRMTAGIRDDAATGAPIGRILVNRALYDRSELQERGTLPI